MIIDWTCKLYIDCSKNVTDPHLYTISELRHQIWIHTQTGKGQHATPLLLPYSLTHCCKQSAYIFLLATWHHYFHPLHLNSCGFYCICRKYMVYRLQLENTDEEMKRVHELLQAAKISPNCNSFFFLMLFHTVLSYNDAKL